MKKMICPLCKRSVPEDLYEMHITIDRLAIQRMKRDFPGWSEKDGACLPCLERYEKLAA